MAGSIRIDRYGRPLPPPEPLIREREARAPGSTGWTFQQGRWIHPALEEFIKKDPPSEWELVRGQYFIGSTPEEHQDAVKRDIALALDGAWKTKLKGIGHKALFLGAVALGTVFAARKYGFKPTSDELGPDDADGYDHSEMDGSENWLNSGGGRHADREETIRALSARASNFFGSNP